MVTEDKNSFEDLYSDYEIFGEEPSDFARFSMPFLKKVNARMILELGCGNGRDSIFFANNGFLVTAVDFSQRAINSLTARIVGTSIRNFINPIKMDILDAGSFYQNSFDAVYAHMALEYFTDEELSKIFISIYSILKTGGVFLFRTRSTNDELYGRGQEIEKDMFLIDGKLRHFFNKDYVFHKAGKFEVENILPSSVKSVDGEVVHTIDVVLKKFF